MPNGASSTSHKKTGGGSSKKVSTASPSTSSSSRRVSGGGSKGGRKGGANTRPTTKNALAKGGLFGLGKKKFEQQPGELPKAKEGEGEKLTPEKIQDILNEQRRVRNNAGIYTLGDKMNDATQKATDQLSKFATSAKNVKTKFANYKTDSTRITDLEREVKHIKDNCCQKESYQTTPGTPAGGRRK